jgi:type I restriction enzyme R subunit
LYVDQKAVGVIEAKPKGHPLKGVEIQSAKYQNGWPKGLPCYRMPLPFAYEATGDQTQFTNILEPDARSREVMAFHRPEELLRLVGLDRQVRDRLRNLPPIELGRLWRVQVEAVQNLERSLADNRPRALIQMATGSGKTFTAVSSCYRLIKFGGARRILFLVDRNNLGKQTLNEFQQYVSPYTNRKFTDEYVVQHLRRNTIDPAAKVCITTIQRVFSMLKGEEEYQEENEEASQFESEQSLFKTPAPVSYNPRIPLETFDFVIIDECHRSIYNLWRQVLEYFDAFLIGLTATPTAQTIGFFGGNLVQEYTHQKAVVDNVNVGYEVYEIVTQITNDGARLAKEPGIFVPHRDRRTKARLYKELDDDLTYTANQLNRDVVAQDQIRLVIRTFRDRLSEIFPGRTHVPKTLVFATNDLHAEDIVSVIREEFGKGNDFCQKITSKSTGKTPDELLADFRNSYNPRIAVTVDMIATGTDVKPLECLLFMRNIKSLSYFEQMKGRGCRILDTDTLQSVTPDAKAKTHFVIVDAVGVCHEDKTATKPLDRQPSVPLDKILNLVGAGAADPDIVSALAARLARLNRELEADEKADISKAAGGIELTALTAGLLRSIDPDEVVAEARKKHGLKADQIPTEEQVKTAEQDRMRVALKPFHDPKLRSVILESRNAHEQVIDEQSRDILLKAGFSAEAVEKARSLITTFKKFIEEHKNEIEALKVLYSRPYKAGLRFGQVKDLAAAIQRPPHNLRPEVLWKAYQALEPDRVVGQGGKALVDVIALVRHAIDPKTSLAPLAVTVDERYQKWLADQGTAGAKFNPEQRRWLDAIKDHIASSVAIEPEDLDELPFNQMGGPGRALEIFGERLKSILQDLNARLVA